MKKLFKIIGSIILILIIAVVFLYCEYSTTGRTTRSKSRSTTDKLQPSIKQLGILPPFLLALEEITIISGTKNAT
jgi:hypothetical protein